MKFSLRTLLLLSVFACATITRAQDAPPVTVVMVGLVHSHASGFFAALPKNTNVKLVGISEADQTVVAKYREKYHLDPSLFYTDTETMLNAVHPQAVLVYTSVHDHRKVVELAAKHGISAMVEKPLATTLEDALAMRKITQEHHVQLLVNYETTWYTSNTEALKEAHEGKLGEIRKVVVHDGHEGPVNTHVPPEFLTWLTDPIQNGAGAMFDFGCYGADLMTVLMHGATPLSVTAVAQTDQPTNYPKVDDDTTIILRYAGTQAVLMPSWDWSFARKDMEIYGTNGYAIAVDPTNLRVRYKGQKTDSPLAAEPMGPYQSTALDYLAGVLRGQIKPEGDLSALDTNIIVMQILDAARQSAKTGRTVELKPLP